MVLTDKMSGTTFRVQKTLAESIMTESPELIETIIANPEIRRIAEEFWKDVGRFIDSSTRIKNRRSSKLHQRMSRKTCQTYRRTNESYKKLTKMVKVVEK